MAKKTTKKLPARRKAVPGKPAAKHQSRTDLGASADSYFADVAPELRAVAAKLRQIIREAAPKASEAIKWGMPVYELSGMLCYIRERPAYVTLGFYHQGIHLSDPDKLLEGTGENMRHVKIRSMADIKGGLFTNWVKQAAAINADI
jgi:hypothetical protein